MPKGDTMRRLIVAVSEFLEAKAELLREEAGGIALGMYARGFKDAREDCDCGCDIYNDADTDD